MKPMKYASFLSLVVLMLAGMSPSVARARETAPSQTVRAFYDGYIASNARAGERIATVKALFEPQLYGALSRADAGIFAANTCPGYVDISRCPYETFDPFSYARTAASSYSIDGVRITGDRALVAVTLQSGLPKAASHVTFVLTRSGARYAISDLLYLQPRYYNSGPIVDLRKFLMMTGALPLDDTLRRSAGSPLGVVKAFYDLYITSHGRIEEHMLATKALLNDSLFEELSTSYATGGGFSVSPCAGCANNLAFDPFVNASSSASSYAVGVPRREGTSILVPVSLRSFSEQPNAIRHVTVVVYQRGPWYVIDNLRYDEPHYYYAGSIGDLRQFLGKWDC
ncbi:MAG: hypothetical protein ABIZ82_11695 [Candidatus Tumulicola sp.]